MDEFFIDDEMYVTNELDIFAEILEICDEIDNFRKI